MLGLATRLLIAQRVLDEVNSSRPALGAVLSANRQWYMMGALGPAIGDFVPFEIPPVAGLGDVPARSPYANVWRQILQVAVGNPSAHPPTPGVVPTLRTLTQVLNRLKQLVNDRNFFGLVAMRSSGALDSVIHAVEDLGQILREFSQQENLNAIATAVGSGSRPRINDPVNLLPPELWTGRDWLSWKRTGRFAGLLLANARAAGDDRFVAYAMGWQITYASLACGSGFVNSVVGSTYRTHWWRTRWIGNFVDTWVWGFYRSGQPLDGSGNPTVPFEPWPSLCAAGLHQWLDVTGGLAPETIALSVVADTPLPVVLPDDFKQFWVQTWKRTYEGQINPVSPLFNERAVELGYLLCWLVLWFQTSGDVIGCNPAPPLKPPSGCGSNPTPPNWIDPTRTNPATKEPFVPPVPSPRPEPNVGEIICGAILGICRIVATMVGAGAVGIAAFAADLALVIDGELQLNWDELECQFYWLSAYFHNGFTALHKLTVLGGLQHPYPIELGAGAAATISVDGVGITYDTAAELTCRSQEVRGPRQPWNATVPNWWLPPVEAPEEPVTLLWNRQQWPAAFVDDESRNPAGQSLADLPRSFDGGTGSFGPAVPAAVNLLLSAPSSLPDWNLDADRGHGWLCWQLHGSYVTPVQSFPET